MNFSEIEVEAEQVAPSFTLDETPVVEEEFIINEIVTNVRDIEVIDAEHLTVEEKSQISFEFDLPIMQPEAVQKETIQFKEVEFEAPAIVSDTVEELKQEQEVTTVFHLDELEVEKELTPIASETTLNDIDVEYKIVSKEEVPFP